MKIRIKRSKKVKSIVRSHLMTIMFQGPNIFAYFIRRMIIGPMTVWSLRTRLPECAQHEVLNLQLNVLIKSMKTNNIKTKTKKSFTLSSKKKCKNVLRRHSKLSLQLTTMTINLIPMTIMNNIKLRNNSNLPWKMSR
jgi:uncharacterized Tic20 family protein